MEKQGGGHEVEEQQMKQDISSLMDGELDARGVTLDASALRQWNEYHLIGDVMRGDPGLGSGVADRVFARLRDEPTVLAPRASRRPSAARVALAAAASVATVAVVGWIGMQGMGIGQPPAPTVALKPVVPAPVPAAARAARPAAPAPDVQDYLVAHRQIPSAEFYRPVAARQR
jgi:sigma-E factor negative regulatory protein RseA